MMWNVNTAMRTYMIVALVICGCGIKVDRDFNNPHDPANSSTAQTGTTSPGSVNPESSTAQTGTTSPGSVNPESKTSVALKFGNNVKLTDGLQSLASVIRVGENVYFTGAYKNSQTGQGYNVIGTIINGIVDLSAITALSTEEITICDSCTKNIEILISNSINGGNLYALSSGSGGDSALYELDASTLKPLSRVDGTDCYYYDNPQTFHFLDDSRLHKINGSRNTSCGLIDGNEIGTVEIKDPHTQTQVQFTNFDSLILHDGRYHAYDGRAKKIYIYSVSWDLEEIYSTAAYLYNGRGGQASYLAFYLPGEPAYMFGCNSDSRRVCYQTEVEVVEQ